VRVHVGVFEEERMKQGLGAVEKVACGVELV
jgi:hypothetical protein